MRISVFGLGYVGSVTAACLARLGHRVLGVDLDEGKVRLINDGRSPIIEAQLPELIAEARAAGTLRGTTDLEEAVRETEVSMVCVGTPSTPAGALDLDGVRRVCRSIGESLRGKSGEHLLLVRSTVLPGTMEEEVIPAVAEASGKEPGSGFRAAFCPEFLRESTSVEDFFHPQFTIIGSRDEAAADGAAALFEGLPAPVVRTSLRTAEMVKYACNAFHAAKVTFANEVGLLCRTAGVDGHLVMSILCQDRKLNISPAYLRPGFAYGGSCLPKDLRALTHFARRADLELPLLSSLERSNRQQVEMLVSRITALGKKRVGLLGLSFKEGTDDLRESPLVSLLETLLGKGYSIRVYDQDVNLAKLFGANRRYIEREIPHISSLMTTDLELVVESSDVLVVGKRSAEFLGVSGLLRPEQHLLDLVRLFEAPGELACRYHGLAW